MDHRKVIVKVPASTANLGPGFDTLGMALNLYTWIELGFARKTSIRMYGDQVGGIPADKSNLIYKVAQQVFEQAGVEHPELAIAMYGEIPLTRGLGSSAAVIVGALVAANALIGNTLSEDTLFQMASRLEEHPDNVGASLFGGLVIAYWDGNRAERIRVEPDPRLDVLVAVPSFHLPTEQARDVLPRQVPLRDAVFNVGHASLLVAALCTGNLEMIRHAMKDKLHEPYRAPLIPGMEQIMREAVQYGALGAALSGAGPTLLALVDTASRNKPRLEQFLRNVFARERIQADVFWLKPCSKGARIILPTDESSSFMETVKGEVIA